MQEFTEYLERLETKKNIQQAMAKRNNQQNNDDDDGGGKKGQNRKKATKNAGKRANNGANGANTTNGKCGHCGGPNHRTEDCWEDDRNANKRPPGWKNRNKRQRRSNNSSNGRNSVPSFTPEQMNFLMQGFEAFKRNDTGKKRKTRADDDDDDDKPHTHFLAQMSSKVDTTTTKNSSDYDSDDYSNCYNKNYAMIGSTTHKKPKNDHMSTEVVGQMVDVRGEILPVRVLLDTGSTSTIVLSKFAKALDPPTTNPVQWSTMGGQFCTRRTASIKLKLPEFSTSKTITWTAHVDETTKPESAMFDLIIGIDLMEALGIDISFKENKITWDDVTIPMKDRGLISHHDALDTLFHTAVQPPIITKAENWQRAKPEYKQQEPKGWGKEVCPVLGKQLGGKHPEIRGDGHKGITESHTKENVHHGWDGRGKRQAKEVPDEPAKGAKSRVQRKRDIPCSGGFKCKVDLEGVFGRVLVAISAMSGGPALTLCTPVPVAVAEALVHRFTRLRRDFLPIGGGAFGVIGDWWRLPRLATRMMWVAGAAFLVRAVSGPVALLATVQAVVSRAILLVALQLLKESKGLSNNIGISAANGSISKGLRGGFGITHTTGWGSLSIVHCHTGYGTH
jgi:hypothetical protein